MWEVICKFHVRNLSQNRSSECSEREKEITCSTWSCCAISYKIEKVARGKPKFWKVNLLQQKCLEKGQQQEDLLTCYCPAEICLSLSSTHCLLCTREAFEHLRLLETKFCKWLWVQFHKRKMCQCHLPFSPMRQNWSLGWTSGCFVINLCFLFKSKVGN
jgi:hypothetical protein